MQHFRKAWEGVLRDVPFTYSRGSTVTQLKAEVVETIRLEADPNGIHQNAPGAKLDAGKIDVGLLWESFPYALMAIADVATFGAAKYTRGGWKEVPHGFIRYKAAEGRHMLYRHQGEVRDRDSKRYHLAHEGWNKLAQLEFFLKEQEEKI